MYRLVPLHENTNIHFREYEGRSGRTIRPLVWKLCICFWFIFRRWNKGIIPLASYWRRGEFSKMLKTTNKETTNYLKFNFKRIKTSQLIWRSVRKLGVINQILRSWAKEWKSVVTQWCFMIWKVFLT